MRRKISRFDRKDRIWSKRLDLIERSNLIEKIGFDRKDRGFPCSFPPSGWTWLIVISCLMRISTHWLVCSSVLSNDWSVLLLLAVLSTGFVPSSFEMVFLFSCLGSADFKVIGLQREREREVQQPDVFFFTCVSTLHHEYSMGEKFFIVSTAYGWKVLETCGSKSNSSLRWTFFFLFKKRRK